MPRTKATGKGKAAPSELLRVHMEPPTVGFPHQAHWNGKRFCAELEAMIAEEVNVQKVEASPWTL